jgi:hypothetical protein
MNIFHVDENPRLAAYKMYFKRHWHKMAVESAQIMSGVAHDLNVSFKGQYKHPGGNPYPSEWVKQSRDNLAWLHTHAQTLLDIDWEYYGKRRDVYDVLDNGFNALVNVLPHTQFTEPYVMIPEGWESYGNPVDCFKAFYIQTKTPKVTKGWLYPRAISAWNEVEQKQIKLLLAQNGVNL